MRQAACLPKRKVVNFIGAAETQPIRRQDVIALGKLRQQKFPTDFSAAAELATMQQHDRAALAGLEIVRANAVDGNVATMNLQVLLLPSRESLS